MNRWAFHLARQIFESDVWHKKPAWWLKVWIYILWAVNHKDTATCGRWECFLNIRKIYNDCYLQKEQIQERAIENVIRWLRDEQQITTRKTVRWIIVKVLKYNTYQNLQHYSNGTNNGDKNGIKTEQERNTNGIETELYKKNVKNVKKEKNTKKRKDFLNKKIDWITINPDFNKSFWDKPF